MLGDDDQRWTIRKPELMIGDGPEGNRSNRKAKQARWNRALSKRKTECLRKLIKLSASVKLDLVKACSFKLTSES
ncbi:unnamed protein product [Microthlaspi erraticum]|uniref:Uncharacterized protein n=1 Tax=Microthlaspi erraticum TaxID=1685480 RepID=A0A6D2IYX7_9BRAS|nr:unnamed protein product [Microthlaspi erraticum]